MLDSSQLELAVSRGIISREQSEALSALAGGAEELQASEIDFSVSADDEPFRLLKGFRDFFIAIGIVILAIGLSMFVEVPFDFSTGRPLDAGDADHSGWIAAISVLVLLGVALLISEWVTKSQRLPLSSLVLTIVFAIWSGMFFGSLMFAAGLSFGIRPNASDALQAIITIGAMVGSVVALLVYYWRYRLPFVLLPLAGVAVMGVLFVFDTMFDLKSDSTLLRVLTGMSGVGVFFAAMWYDLKDRYRTTRLSECAFWLHLLAAPMIVHSVLANRFEGDLGSVTILMVVIVLAIFALIIDRRAMLVSALAYMGYSIFKIIESLSFFGNFNNSAAFVILGIFILGLGLGWAPIRRFFVTNLVWKSLRDKLPPVIA